jgi:hypothetical protein
MAIPNTRDEFKEYCLRKLGHPVINIDLSEEQLDDRVDEALKFYADYHFDGSEKTYYKYQIQVDDVVNKYITMPDNILGVVRIFPIADPSVRSDDLFNIKYQMALNDLYSLTSTSLIPYYMAYEHLNLIQELLVGQQPIRYKRHVNKLYVDMDWERVNAGQYLLVEAYQVVDPETYTEVWGDRWLQNYCSVLIKENWGAILTKHVNTMLPGGVQLNGAQIYQDAYTERLRLEEEIHENYSIPPEHFVG